MRATITLLALFAATFYSTAQITPTLVHNDLDSNNTLEEVEDMAIFNNEAYFSLPEDGKIVKVSLAAPNAPIVDVVTGITFPSRMAFVGSELYFVQTANAAMQPNTGKLCKIDVAAANPVVTVLYSTLQYPIDLEMNGSTAYVAETYVTGPINDPEVEHMELSVVIGTTKTVLYNAFYSIDDLEYYNNALYVVNYTENTDATNIVKVDVTNNTPVTPQVFWTDVNQYYPYNIEISGAKLYMNVDINPGSIYQLDLLNPAAPMTLVANQFQAVPNNNAYVNEMIVLPNNMLYAIGEYQLTEEGLENFALFSVDISTLSSNSFELADNKVRLYPNPAAANLDITNYEAGKAYQIYTLEGKLVKEGLYNNSISINSLSAGMYIVKLEGGISLKLQKQ